MTAAAPRTFRPPPSAMTESAFVARFGGVYEHSPWIAEAAYRHGLIAADDTPTGLAATLAAVLAAADRDAKLTLIRAHPDLAGRAAVAGDLTDASKGEQAGAGLDRCTPAEFQRFQHLNAAYRERFGFPFILAVAGRGRTEILQNFELRLGNDAKQELVEALRQIDRIAAIRLDALAE